MKIKINNKQLVILSENISPSYDAIINSFIDSDNITALAHYYSNVDDEGKINLLNKVKNIKGDVFAQRIKVRASGAMEEGLSDEEITNISNDVPENLPLEEIETHDSLSKEFSRLNKEYLILDKKLESASENESFQISQKMEDLQSKMSVISSKIENTLEETTTTGSVGGQYSSKYFLDPSHGKNPKVMFKGGAVIKPNDKQHTSGVNSFTVIKGKLKEEINNMIGENQMGNNVVPKKVVSLVTNLQNLIKQAVDSDGDVVGVVDRNGTWQSEDYYSVDIKDGVVVIRMKPDPRNHGANEQVSTYNFNDFAAYRQEIAPYEKDYDHEYWDTAEYDPRQNILNDCVEELKYITRLYNYTIKKLGKNMNVNDVNEVSSTDKKEPVWMAVATTKGSWDNQPQQYLGVISWSDAVKTAKSTGKATRLSNSEGFSNQGHYIQPDMVTVDDLKEVDINTTVAPVDQTQEKEYTTEDLFKIYKDVVEDCGEESEEAKSLKSVLIEYGDFENPATPITPEAIVAFKQVLPDEQVTEDSPISDNLETLRAMKTREALEAGYSDEEAIRKGNEAVEAVKARAKASKQGMEETTSAASSGQFNGLVQGREEQKMQEYHTSIALPDWMENALLNNNFDGLNPQQVQQVQNVISNAKDFGKKHVKRSGVGDTHPNTIGFDLIDEPAISEMENEDDFSEDDFSEDDVLASFSVPTWAVDLIVHNSNKNLSSEQFEMIKNFISNVGSKYNSTSFKTKNEEIDGEIVVYLLKRKESSVVPTSDNIQVTEPVNEEAVTSSPAIAKLKSIHAETARLTKGDMKKVKNDTIKATTADGTQFIDNTDGVKSSDSENAIGIDNTIQSKEIDLIKKGMEDLEYSIEPGKDFKERFEDNINPDLKTDAVTDQFGFKTDAGEMVNVLKTDTGEKILKNVETKQKQEEPMYAKDPQPVKIVKETEEFIITESEQLLIESDLDKMKKLFNFSPSQTISNKGNKKSRDLFKK